MSINLARRGVLHDLGVDAIARRARFEHDPGKDHRLAGLKLHAAREGGELADLHVIGDAFLEFERAVLPPDLAGLLCHAAIGG